MTTTYSYREGDTEPIDITLLDAGSAANITGYTSVAVFLRSEDGLVQSEGISTGGSPAIVVVSASAGTIQIVPANLTTALTFAKVRFYGYFIVLDGSSRRSSFPSGDNFVVKMLERYSGDG